MLSVTVSRNGSITVNPVDHAESAWYVYIVHFIHGQITTLNYDAHELPNELDPVTLKVNFIIFSSGQLS